MIQKWCYSFSQFLSDFVTITINCVLFTCWSVIGIQKCSLWMWCAEQSASIRCIFFLSRLPMRQYLRITWKCAISLSASMPYGHFNPSELAIRFLTTCHAFLTNLNLNLSSFSNFWKGDFLVLVVFLFFANTNFKHKFQHTRDIGLIFKGHFSSDTILQFYKFRRVSSHIKIVKWNWNGCLVWECPEWRRFTWSGILTVPAYTDKSVVECLLCVCIYILMVKRMSLHCAECRQY